MHIRRDIALGKILTLSRSFRTKGLEAGSQPYFVVRVGGKMPVLKKVSQLSFMASNLQKFIGCNL